MAILKKPKNPLPGQNQYWYIIYSVPGRKYPKWESVGRVGDVSKKYCEALLAEKKRKIKWGEHEENIVFPTLNDFSKEYLDHIRVVSQKRSWRNDQSSLKRLCSVFGDRYLNNIKTSDIMDYQAARLKDGVSNATVNRELACLRHLCNLARSKGRFAGKSPFTGVKWLPEDLKQYVLSPEDEQAFFNVCDPQLKPIFMTMLNTGMRLGEVLSLRWKCVNLKNNYLTVTKDIAKSKKARNIPVNDTLRTLLLEQKLITGRSDHVFHHTRGGPYRKHDSLDGRFRKIAIKAGLPELRTRDFRHTAATRMIEAGASVMAVKEILGHYSVKMTERYVHPEKSLVEAVEMLNNRPSLDYYKDRKI